LEPISKKDFYYKWLQIPLAASSAEKVFDLRTTKPAAFLSLLSCQRNFPSFSLQN